MLTDAVRLNASDIHLEPQKERSVIRLRVDGMLREHAVLDMALHPSAVSRIKIMADMDIAEQRLPQEGRADISAGDKLLDLRVSTIPTIHGEKAVMRMLDREMSCLPLEGLGMSGPDLRAYDSMIRRTSGMLVVTGPTGSGKTTTLYSTLNHIRSPEVNIVTIEDPVEYELPGICQMHVNQKAGLTFARGLRSILRQDPNIIMVGEIRDEETASIAISAAMTGHLVMSTMHTADSASAITRLVDLGIEPYLVSAAVSGVVAQRLVRLVCEKCRGEGCADCGGSGYRNRTGIFEVMPLVEDLKELIGLKCPRAKLRGAAIKLGMSTLEDDGREKVKKGLTTTREVSRVTRLS